MRRQITRREFIQTTGAAITGASLMGTMGVGAMAAKRTYDISLAGWSLHRAIGKKDDQRDMLDMPQIASEDLGINAIELVNQMMSASDPQYIGKLAANASKYGTKILLIMIDNAGAAGADSREERNEAVKKHKEWIDVAADLGCHSVRMNWAGAPKKFLNNEAVQEDMISRSVKTFRKIAKYGDKKGLNVMIENHGGPSSYPDHLIELIKRVDHPRFGTLPDFGNFPEDVDIYDAIDRMMPYAKAVSAKCYDFDDETGLETKLDFERLISNVVDKHGYHGYIGIEYEGNRLSEPDGIVACRKLLEKLRE